MRVKYSMRPHCKISYRARTCIYTVYTVYCYVISQEFRERAAVLAQTKSFDKGDKKSEGDELDIASGAAASSGSGSGAASGGANGEGLGVGLGQGDSVRDGASSSRSYSERGAGRDGDSKRSFGSDTSVPAVAEDKVSPRLLGDASPITRIGSGSGAGSGAVSGMGASPGGHSGGTPGLSDEKGHGFGPGGERRTASYDYPDKISHDVVGSPELRKFATTGSASPGSGPSGQIGTSVGAGSHSSPDRPTSIDLTHSVRPGVETSQSTSSVGTSATASSLQRAPMSVSLARPHHLPRLDDALSKRLDDIRRTMGAEVSITITELI
jgi:hypothetical protein